MASHFLIMCLFSVLVGSFFAALTKDTLGEGIKAAAMLSITMVGVSLIIAYIMYFLPLHQ
jgi:hypothetical protein